MKRYIAVIAAVLVVTVLSAQKFRVSVDTVKYGVLFKNVLSSYNLTIYNDAPFDMPNVVLKPFNRDMTLSDSVISIPAKSSKQVAVRFKPRHNVDYSVPLLVMSNSPYGSLNVQLKGTGFYTGAYYTTTQNKWESDLLAALKTRTGQGYVTLGYTVARDFMYGSVDNIGGKVTCVYTGRSAFIDTRAEANDSNFTAEHTFPRSKYNSVDPMFSDLHHLFPADGPANTRRSDDPYGIVTSPVWQVGGSLSDNSKFEPRDAHKGTAARALFYFVMRYQDYTNFFDPQEDLMREWAFKFPVTAADSSRNERVNAVQGNRNPFTDHPEFIERISNFVGPAPALQKKYYSTYTGPVNLGYVALGDTVRHKIILVNTGTDVLAVQSFPVNPKPLPNVTGTTETYNLAPNEARIYTYTFVGRNTGTNFTDSFNLNITGLSLPVVSFRANVSGLTVDEMPRTNITAYPNPATTTVSISADRALRLPCTVNFYDVAGKVVYSTVLNESFTDLNIDALQAGCYFVQVNDGTTSSLTKLVKY